MSKWEIGVDGWPVSPDHPANRWSADSWRQQRFDSEMRAGKLAVEAGNLIALERVLIACGRHNAPLPPWAGAALVAVVRDYARGGHMAKKRGRTGNLSASYRENQKHFARWSEVEYLRASWAEIRDADGRPAFSRMPSLEQAYAHAAEESQGQPYEASADSYAASHKKVARDINQNRAGLFVQRR